jgi:hypothetical protein
MSVPETAGGFSVAVGGIGVAVGIGVSVGGTGVKVSVDGTSVCAAVQPLSKIASNTNARQPDPIDLFMMLSPDDVWFGEAAPSRMQSGDLPIYWQTGRLIICNVHLCTLFFGEIAQ